MTVADLTPIQFYGLMMCAFLVIVASLLAWREYDRLTLWRQKAIFWVGFILLIGFPAISGITALRP